jgi:hypothetical protein
MRSAQDDKMLAIFKTHCKVLIAAKLFPYLNCRKTVPLCHRERSA